MGILGDLTEKYHDGVYVVFRVMVGVLFLQHGLQKMFGLLGGNAAAVGSIFWFAGLFELMIGPALVFGVLTRLAAAGGVVQMLYAFFSVHVPMGGFIPIVNKGELALLFATAFLIVVVHGAKNASLEKAIFGKEFF